MENSGQRAAINILYIMLTAVTVFACTPTIEMQIIAFFLALVFLACAYLYRTRDRNDGLLYNHMTYMIGTFWASSTILVIASLISGFLLQIYGDNTAVDNAFMSIESGNMDIMGVTKSGMETYVQDNKSLLLVSTCMTFAPTALYFIYRLANGYSRAMKGYRIADPKSWL